MIHIEGIWYDLAGVEDVRCHEELNRVGELNLSEWWMEFIDFDVPYSCLSHKFKEKLVYIFKRICVCSLLLFRGR